MSPKLKNSLRVWKLVRDLGIKSTNDPVSSILKFCDNRIRNFLKDFPRCNTLSDLLEAIASRLGTIFEIASSDLDLRRIKQKYLEKGEKAFVQLEDYLSEDVFGITFRRCNRELWEPEFVSVIDCRRSKAARSYYTKWHEIAHLLILTDQMRLSFQRTHCPMSEKDPEESLVDVIAGNFGFYSSIIRGHVKNEITFDAIEHLRIQLCPEASQQSSLIGFVKAWPHPCLLVHCEMALRKHEQAMLKQQMFNFEGIRVPSLRATHVTTNEEARKAGFIIFENMRIPERSVINRVYSEGIEYAEAEEDLCWWDTSDGTRLSPCPIRVKAKRSWDSVDALIIPIK
jgi:hypothetical protein